MRFNTITSPGGWAVRVFRLIVTGRPMYEIPLPVLNNTNSLEAVFFEAKVEKNILPLSILRLFNRVDDKKGGLSVYVHGSYADGTTSSFSDIDDLVVIDDSMLARREYMRLVRRLNRIDMDFCRIDPLQHHGHWIISRSELECYDNSFLPLWLLRDAINVVGEPKLSAKIDKCATVEGLRRNIKATCENIERLGSKLIDGNITAYEMKCLVGSFALMPAFLFQMSGADRNKPESIKFASKFYSPISMECIAWSTNCRSNWSAVTETFRFKLFSWLPFLFVNPYIWRRFSEKCSPRICRRQIRALSSITITGDHISSFVRESQVNA